MPSAKPAVLVAEDERALSKALALKLGAAGFAVTVVNDGEEAVRALREGEFRAVVLDLVMPKVDGFAVLASIKEMKVKVPVIVLSNLTQAEDQKKVEALGAKEYLVKSDTPIADVVAHVMRLTR